MGGSNPTGEWGGRKVERMGLTICVLGSSSQGNCTYVGTDTTALLVDAGFSARETLRRMEEVGLEPARVQGILVTHEHSDHTQGLGVLHRRFGWPVYANSATADKVDRMPLFEEQPILWRIFQTGQHFRIGDIEVESFSVPHDAGDPVGFRFGAGGVRVGLVTDMGMATTLIRERLRPCRALVVEANHDEDLLKNSGRPWSLIQRILSRHGHLSNGALAELLGEIGHGQMTDVFLAHLSEECNKPELACWEVLRALQSRRQSHIRIHLTYPDRPSERLTIEPEKADGTGTP